MSHSDWMRWCNLSHSVEPSALLTRLDVLSFTAVAAYTAAVAIAVFFLMRWFKLSVSSQHQIWAGLKLFLVSIAGGCAFGCARQAVHRQAYALVFYDGVSAGDSYSSAENWSLLCAYWVPMVLLVSLEAIFITHADLQILHCQLQKLLSAESVQPQRLRLSKVLKAIQILLLMVNVTHLGVSCACAAWNVASSNRFSQSAAAYRSGDSATGGLLFNEAYGMSGHADYYQGIALCLQSFVSITILLAFTVFGVYFLRIILLSERFLSEVELRIPIANAYQKRVTQSAISLGRSTRWRIKLVLFLILCAYSIRAAVDLMYAYGYVNAHHRSTDCGACGDCQPIETLFFIWWSYHPEVPIITGIIAAPLALTLSLYGMVGKVERQLLFQTSAK